MGTKLISELDSVVLLADCGSWPRGTVAVAVALLDCEMALVEVVGTDGRTLDLLEAPLAGLAPVASTVPASSRGLR